MFDFHPDDHADDLAALAAAILDDHEREPLDWPEGDSD